MLHEVSGDILLARAQAIAHGVAPNDGHNQGLAHALRESWPAMYKDFRHFCQTTHPKAGEMWVWGSAEGRRVASLFTPGDSGVSSREYPTDTPWQVGQAIPKIEGEGASRSRTHRKQYRPYSLPGLRLWGT